MFGRLHAFSLCACMHAMFLIMGSTEISVIHILSMCIGLYMVLVKQTAAQQHGKCTLYIITSIDEWKIVTMLGRNLTIVVYFFHPHSMMWSNELSKN